MAAGAVSSRAVAGASRAAAAAANAEACGADIAERSCARTCPTYSMTSTSARPSLAATSPTRSPTGGAQATRAAPLHQAEWLRREPGAGGQLIELFLPYLRLKSTPRTERQGGCDTAHRRAHPRGQRLRSTCARCRLGTLRARRPHGAVHALLDARPPPNFASGALSRRPPSAEEEEEEEASPRRGAAASRRTRTARSPLTCLG